MFSIRDRLFDQGDSSFEDVALEVFAYQYHHVDVYRAFCDGIRRTVSTVNHMAEIPFLPVEFFRSHPVISSEKNAEMIFESSGTTQTAPSKHYVADISLYERSFLRAFNHFYGAPGDYVFLALLPSYLERQHSSLVFMTETLIRLSGKKESGFFLNEFEKLKERLVVLKERKQKVILLGVTFALLDFAGQFNFDFPELIVMETGGMKGRREELTRLEIHQQLCKAFGVEKIHSEYGMTELLSQAYSQGDGVFRSPPWMKILIRDIYDPLRLQEDNITGAVNVIDLANLYSCSFIATGDWGKVNADCAFEILGRIDGADVRGCNLMVL